MVWSQGDGITIIIGKDRIFEMGDATLLLEELIDNLNKKGLFYLFQAQKPPKVGLIGTNWFTSEDLDLIGHLQGEWNRYRLALINNDVLQTKPDSLKWVGGNKYCLITVKNIYMASKKLKWTYISSGWWRASWGWTMPLKIKLFIWLLAENKLFFWENQQHKGHRGSSICLLCKNSDEKTQHLFLDYAFIEDVWQKLKSAINYECNWSGNNIYHCFKLWSATNPKLKSLPALIC